MTENRIIGRRFDGGQSPLGGKIPLAGTLAMALVGGGENDSVVIPGTTWCTDLRELRKLIPKMFDGMTPAQFAALPGRRQDELTRKLRRVMEREMRRQKPGLVESFHARHEYELASRERERVFNNVLVPWSLGPLVLERPQASSLHHLLEYDARCTPGGFASALARDDDTQSFVVENDWARASAAGGDRRLEASVRALRLGDADIRRARPDLHGGRRPGGSIHVLRVRRRQTLGLR